MGIWSRPAQSDPAVHSNWFGDGHVICSGPIKYIPMTFAGTIMRESLSFCQHTHLVGWKPGGSLVLMAATFSLSLNQTGNEPVQENAKLRDKYVLLMDDVICIHTWLNAALLLDFLISYTCNWDGFLSLTTRWVYSTSFMYAYFQSMFSLLYFKTQWK